MADDCVVVEKASVSPGRRALVARRYGAGLAAILVVAAAIRVLGLGNEPFWLDEILSYDFTSGSAMQLLRATARDVHPPLYYLGLLGWRHAVGSSVAAVRGYSTLWSLIGIAAIAALGTELGRSRKVGLTAAAVMALNPLDVYFAQETRMYSQAAALGTFSTFVLLRFLRHPAEREPRKNAWLLVAYATTASLLVLTHYIGVTILLAQGFFVLVYLQQRRRAQNILRFLAAPILVAVLFLPWVIVAVRTTGHLFDPKMLAWIPAPTLGNVRALFARDLFWGYPGLTRQKWGAAEAASWAVLVSTLALFVRQGLRKHRGGSAFQDELGIPAGFAMWMALAPVGSVVFLSVVYRPLFYHPRFGILILPFVLVSIALVSTRARPRGVGVALLLVAMAVEALACGLQQRAITKSGMGHFADLWRAEGPPNAVYFYPRWNRQVAEFYLRQRLPVLGRSTLIERLHGDSVTTIWLCTITGYQPDLASGARAQRNWLLSLGVHRTLATVDGLTVVEIKAPPAKRLYPKLCPGTRVDFGTHDADPYLWKGWYQPERTLRWSRGTNALVLFSLDGSCGLSGGSVAQAPRRRAVAGRFLLQLVLGCLGRQRVHVTLNGVLLGAWECRTRAAHTVTFAIPQGTIHTRNELAFELRDAVSPAELGRSRDHRKLAIAVRSLSILRDVVDPAARSPVRNGATH